MIKLSLSYFAVVIPVLRNEQLLDRLNTEAFGLQECDNIITAVQHVGETTEDKTTFSLSAVSGDVFYPDTVSFAKGSCWI